MALTEDHETFRQTVRGVCQRVIAPHADKWEQEGIWPAHDVLPAFAEAGLLGLEYDPKWGGQGADNTYTAVFAEELGRAGCAGVAMGITDHTDMATPSLHRFGSDELKEKYLVPALKGEHVAGIAVTEPDAGSDVAGIRSKAVRDGDEWIINGSKMFITNAMQADWLCLLVRTSEEGGHRGMSQIVFPTKTDGFEARSLHKLGNKSSDTCELTFDDCRVPVANTIGTIGRGFQQQMQQFQNERMVASYSAVGSMQKALAETAAYLKERKAFGKPLLANQHIQFELAQLAAEVDMLKVYNYAAAEAASAGKDITREATMAKVKVGPLLRRVIDTCLQFHGGMGYMEETWTARAFRDARLISIGGGADEVMIQYLALLEGYVA